MRRSSPSEPPRRSLGVPRLTGATIYVTMEPCSMCAGAIVLATTREARLRLPRPQGGYAGSLGNIVDDPLLNHRAAVDVRCAARPVRRARERVLRECQTAERGRSSDAERDRWGDGAGRSWRSRKPLYPLGYRGFESHPHRQIARSER